MGSERPVKGSLGGRQAECSTTIFLVSCKWGQRVRRSHNREPVKQLVIRLGAGYEGKEGEGTSKACLADWLLCWVWLVGSRKCSLQSDTAITWGKESRSGRSV